MKRRAKPRFDPKAFLAKANGGRTISTYPQKSVIFAQGDAADAVFYVKTGKVKVTIVSKEGKEAVVAILGTDEFFGEGILIGKLKRLATASAMTECVIMRVEKVEIMRVIRDEPTFSQMFMSHILTRSARIEEDLVDQLFNSSEKRLARALLLLARYGKPDPTHRELPRVTHETLAEMIGTTRSRVNFFMNKFKRLGCIEYNGGLKVNHSLLTVVLHD